MKLKGAVKFFAIAMAVVCVFQLSFTFIAKQKDAKAQEFSKKFPLAQQDSMRHRYLDSIAHRAVFSIPFIHKYDYYQVKERELNLGLDLRGGMHVTLEVEQNELLKTLSDNNNDKTFNDALNQAKEQQKTSQRNYIDLFYEDIQKIRPDVKLAAYFATLGNSNNIKFSSSNEEVIKWLKTEATSALERTFNVIKTRIDKFGVTQPNIQLVENTGRIIVELPGVDDEARVKKYLQGSAKLEFYECYTLNELFPSLKDADNAYYVALQADKGVKTDTTKKDTAKGATNQNPLGNGIAAADNAKAKTNSLTGEPAESTATKIDTAKKAAAVAAKKPAGKDSAQHEQPLFLKLFGAVGQLTKDMFDHPVVGIVNINDTAAVTKMLNRPEVRAQLPPEAIFMWEAKPIQNPKDKTPTDLVNLIALRTTGIPGHEAALGGDVITDARADIDPNTNNYIVDMTMNSTGATQWAAITKRNIKKSVAIVLDDVVYSYPNVNDEIRGGRSQISGNFTAEESKDLANILKAGKLPVRVKAIETKVVGPSLGQQAINKGLASLIVGLICILLFMVLYYNRSGWVANIALFVNLFFIIGILASLNAALTLPGMAGIVLTLAMAVDANVLIYERVRDELMSGKSMRIAIADGFKHALSSIIDANMVTLAIGIILLTFGQGPIYGFAVVLVIGILTTLFCSILVTRLMFDWLLAKDKKITFGTNSTNNLFRHINYDFVGKRRIAYWFSGTVILIGLLSLTFRGLNYGVDFKGGYDYVISFHKAVNGGNVQSTLTSAFGTAPEVKTYGNDTTLNIITDYMVTSSNEKSDSIVQATMMTALQKGGFEPGKVLSSYKVGATIASDIKQSAFGSILVSLIFIFIYIVARFRRWQFALGATVSLAHDILFVLTIFSLFKDLLPFSLSVDQAIVAALLTISCYSMNDTVVVFDRIREYLNNNKKSPMIPTINEAINKTLSRTLVTSFTIFVVVLILFLFGGQVIKGFAFALLIGVLIGTYSSIFVATPIVIDFQKKDKDKQIDL